MQLKNKDIIKFSGFKEYERNKYSCLSSINALPSGKLSSWQNLNSLYSDPIIN